jgi:DNA polymerase-4
VSRLPGLGRKKGDAVQAAGIKTLGELRAASDATLWPLFGKGAQHMRDRAAGRDERPVINQSQELSISAERTFDVDIDSAALLHAEILSLADRASRRLRAQALMAGSVSIKIRRADFSTQTRQRPLVPPSHDTRSIAEVADALLTSWREIHPGAALRLLGVALSSLSDRPQTDLFDAPGEQKNPKLDSAMDQIRAKFGTSALFRAISTPDRDN